ncbi:MAG TPA: iron-containing alcohol dehydrogenase [Candidatus Hydrogenedentes bacterium]|nr:iron-containing alcohol dehydrogenase [Candidatus Hydrogenedentota bacterium]HRT21982.1 iron-containing alcohol dehydrogenase [Candidatus Hydrogenedentota bacterium]HRT65308.1 iron-containing alcohol dehydrogenase [Candidatus Hydrogenedentota bacterium]
MYIAPMIESGAGAARKLKTLPGTVLVASMEIPWSLFRKQVDWEPFHLHFVEDMDMATLESLERTLPPCDIVVGLGGGSCCDTAKYLAWKRGCRMILVPTIVSVDAPLTNMVAVRVNKAVKYVGDIFPREVIVDHDLIRQAPPELNRAGAADIASIHTALHDWDLAHRRRGEAFDAEVAQLAADCLAELDRAAADVHDVTPRGIDAIVDLYRREVEFCARIGTSRPEEGSEHLVAYNIEHLTRRHFVHGDLVALGIFLMTRLQDNRHKWAVDLMDRLGLRYRVPGVTRTEVRQCLETLKTFVDREKMFFSVVDEAPITDNFIEDALDALYG